VEQSTTIELVPDWLTTSPTQPTQAVQAQRRRVTKELLLTTFEQTFERVLTEMAKGRTLKSVIVEDVRDLDYDAFWRWIKQDSMRYERYKEAKELRTEWWAGRIIEIAEAEDSIEDVARSKLKIDTYKWLMGADNRKQYGESKQIEVNQSISIISALQQANSRIAPSNSPLVEEVVDLIELTPDTSDNPEDAPEDAP
jgi:hypothetical protein